MTYEEAYKRAEEIVAPMTAEEKASQLLNRSPAIERLGIKEYNWWNEAAHGVARSGIATVFPQAIGLAATFNRELIQKAADAVSTEGRAKYNKYIEYGDRGIYKGLTFWAPNINIVRDPRWGRGQETFGEDPFLSSSLGGAYIKGLQGDGEFLKAAACAKHFAVHSGPEHMRHSFNAEVEERDLWETYLPAFEHAVDTGVIGVMGAYNRTNGEPCCASETLIKKILREKWGFKGYFVSDCGAVRDIYENHHTVSTLAEAAALALKNGCDLNCGTAYETLMDAYEEDLITEDDLTQAAVHLFTIRVLLGEFEENRPYSDIPYSMLDCPAHRELNEETARQCLVLLKNENNFLPLDPNAACKIAVVGPNGNSIRALEGNYQGTASEYITPAGGIRKIFSAADVRVADGAWIERIWRDDLVSEGWAAASEADITVLCVGLDWTVEGEEMEKQSNLDKEVLNGYDRIKLILPEAQRRLAEAVCDACENVIVVIESGCAMDLGERVRSHAKAIIQAWYPGARGGLAIAELLAGKFSPSGRLPITFYHDYDPLPDFADYAMENRTYRFLRYKPLYPFGYGLSFTSFKYDNLQVISSDEKTLRAAVTVTNTGSRRGMEKVQFYASFTDSRTRTPNFQLCGIACAELEAGESARVETQIEKYWLKAVLPTGERVDPDGEIVLYAGGHQPDELSNELCDSPCVKLTLNK